MRDMKVTLGFLENLLVAHKKPRKKGNTLFEITQNKTFLFVLLLSLLFLLITALLTML